MRPKVNCQWQLVVVCDPKVGVEIDENAKVADLPDAENSGMRLDYRDFLYPLVKGSYSLLNKKDNTLLFHREVTGIGSAVDTALDDFAEKVASALSDSLETLK